MTRRLLVPLTLVVVSVVVVATSSCSSSDAGETADRARRDVSAYEGLGTWVDVYDYVPSFQDGSGPPAVTPGAVEDMAGLGVRTLYLQAAQDDDRSDGDLVDPELVGRFLERAHDAGIRVVAWYLPKLDDPDGDVRRIQAMHEFEMGGERFDGVALDIEWTRGVPDPGARNTALVSVVEESRRILGDRALGAIVLEPVLLEVVNDQYWPSFPWRDLEPLVDVWLPMSYWTNRSSDSGYRDGYSYADENLRRLRANVGDPEAPVHLIGGIADQAGAGDYAGFVRAGEEHGALGWSVYDFDTTTSAAWAYLRGASGSAP